MRRYRDVADGFFTSFRMTRRGKRRADSPRYRTAGRLPALRDGGLIARATGRRGGGLVCIDCTGDVNMKRDQKITVIEYVHTAEGGVQRVDELEPERYARFREWLIGTWFNELHRGMAEAVFPKTGKKS